VQLRPSIPGRQAQRGKAQRRTTGWDRAGGS
jgi:hypothetical protein